MRENSHWTLPGRKLAGPIMLLTFLLFSAAAAAQNCSPDTEPPVLTLLHPLLAGVNDGDTLVFNCGQQAIFLPSDASATDNCDPAPFVYFTESLEQGTCLTDGFIFNMHCCWIAYDASNNNSQVCIQVLITDSEAPLIGSVPGDLTVDQTAGDTIPSPASPAAVDGCYGLVQVLFSEENIPDADSCGYTLLRTWMATDSCGNTASKTQNLTVIESCVNCPADIVISYSLQPATCAMSDGAVIAQVGGNAADYQYALLPANGVQTGDGNEFSGLPAGDYSLTVSLPSIPNCEETVNFTINQTSCVDTLPVTISQTEQICLDGMGVLDYSGSVTSSSLCNSGNPATVEATTPDSTCVTLVPATGFSGTSPDVICVIQCFGNNPAQCDTTYLVVTVTPPPCLLAFAAITALNTTCGLDNGSIKFGLNGVQGPIAYTWSPDVSTNNMAHNLAAGAYFITVEDQSNGCSADTVITLASSTAPTLQLTVTPETCAGDDGSITISVTGGTGNLTYAWSPDVSTTNTASGLSNSQTYSATVTDEAGCSNSIADVAVGYDCDTTATPPVADIISLVFECGTDSLPLCTYLDELAGNFDHLTICQGPANGNLFPANDTCLLYVPNVGFSGDDSCCVLLCDDLGVCDTFFFEILVEDCISQIPCIVLASDYAIASVADCGAKAKICLEYDLGEILLYDFFIDGLPYDGVFDICAFDTIVSYGFAAIPGNAMFGPYNLQSWKVDGEDFSGAFDNVFEMVGLMNQLDPAGSWTLDTATLNIVSYNSSVAYGPMSIVQTSSGDITTLNINTTTAPTGSSLYLPVGKHEIVLTHQQYAFCTDTLPAEVFCIPGKLPVARTDVDTTALNSDINIDVLANDDINGDLTEISIVIPPKHGLLQVNGDHTFTYQPGNDFCGTEDFVYRICNENGCDTAVVIVEVRCERVIVFNGFSPNDDGMNDTFIIRGLEFYPGHELRVYNRWGNEIYRSKNYKSNWDGRYRGTSLPDGTYFYYLDLGNGTILKGFVQLNR